MTQYRARLKTKDGVIIEKEREHRYIYFHSNPKPPWICAYCDFEMWEEDTFVIHHIDGTKRNNNLENLAPMHAECHGKHHWGVRCTGTG